MTVHDHFKKIGIGNIFEGSKILIKARKHNAVSFFLTLFLLIIVGFYISKSMSVKAENTTFYPTSCLGGWVNPHHAEGKPEVTGDTDETFNGGNSAVLSENTVADIYCGEFDGEIPGGSFAKKIVLTFSWATARSIQDGTAKDTDASLNSTSSPASSTAPVISGIDDTSTSTTESFTTGSSTIDTGSNNDNSTASSGEIIPTNTTEPENNVQNTPQADPQPQPPTESQPAPVSTPEPEPQSVPHATTGSPQTMRNNTQDTFLSKLFEKINNSELFATKAFADEIPIQENNGNEFLEVSYTIDGKKWNVLGTIGAEHLKYATFEIPLARDTKWENMSNIQIGIKSLSSIDGIPAVYLDSMSLEVTHGDASDADFVSESGLYIPTAHSDLDKFNFQIRTTEDIEELVVSGSAPLGNIVVYNASTSEVLMTTYVQGEKYILQPEYFGSGNYILIATSDPNACANLSLADCQSGGGYIGEGNFTVDKKAPDPVADTVVKADSDNSTSSASTTIPDLIVPDEDNSTSTASSSNAN